MEYGIANLKNIAPNYAWSITARVLIKSQVKNNDQGNRKHFKILLIDKNTDINAIAYGNDVDHLFSQLQEDRVYNIKNGRVQLAKYKSLNQSKNDNEIVFNNLTNIIEMSEVTDIPYHLQLKTIKDVFLMAKETFIDTIGVIIKIEKTQETRHNTILKNIKLADNSGDSVNVTLWDTQATTFNANKGDVMSIIGGKISEFNNGTIIKVSSDSRIIINPNNWKETLELNNWYKKFELKERLNLSQDVSIGSQDLSMFESSQSNIDQTINEQILQQNRIDDDLISKRLLELNDEEHKIDTERKDLSFKKQRLSIERHSINSRLEH